MSDIKAVENVANWTVRDEMKAKYATEISVKNPIAANASIFINNQKSI